jgi:DNA helicase-4
MSLIQCPECHKQISDKAESCPHCGLPGSYFKGNEGAAGASLVKDAASDHHVGITQGKAWELELGQLFMRKGYVSRMKVRAFCDERSLSDVEHAEICTKVDQWNDGVIKLKLSEHKAYFDSILHAVDPAIKLDDEQRAAILSDEEYCLVIAGAGAGKTTTMAAKVKYLVDVKKVQPEKIVVISYTNKAIDELEERINKKLNIPVKISTFHSFGYEILRQSSGEVPSVNFSSYNIVYECLKKAVFTNPRLLRNLVLFLGYYFDLPNELAKFKTLQEYSTYKANLDYETLKSRLGEYNQKTADNRSSKNRTIEGEFLRSAQEVQIANFLYLNGIEYEYEKPYKASIAGARKIYTPDFCITQGENECYLEHFGITENYQSYLYDAKEMEKYKRSIIDKRKLHRDNNTVLIETWANYNDERPLLDHLKEELESKGFVLTPRSDEEVYRKLTDTAQDKYIYRLIKFMIRFIESYKACGFDASSFSDLRQKTKNVRIRMFLDIAEDVYSYYQSELKIQGRIDYADMINDAEKILKEIKNSKNKPSYEYIIIDEFQDIAKQRFNLTKTLAEVTGAKVVAVGDDWQSIFAFAGSDITLFQRFLEIMGDGKQLFINHTYRNAQELIDIAGAFIQRNRSQISKKLISPKKLSDPVRIESYDDSSNIRKNWVKKIEYTVGEIVKEFGDKKSILIIGRYNFDGNYIVESGLFSLKDKNTYICNKYPTVSIDFLTAHSSKGLGYDNVILANMIESRYGFPCQIDDDPIMKLVIHDDTTIVNAEERRLFYVALTRTKNRVYLVTPRSKPSRFVLELVNDFKIPHDPQMSMVVEDREVIRCPVCDFPLKYENNKNYGLPLYICTNEPELCGFMTNDKKVSLDIYKCPKCPDGFMIVKKNRKNEDRFYGCTNYSAKGVECKNMAKIHVSL